MARQWWSANPRAGEKGSQTDAVGAKQGVDGWEWVSCGKGPERKETSASEGGRGTGPSTQRARAYPLNSQAPLTEGLLRARSSEGGDTSASL